ncbi:MAG: hypothetical protein ACREC6_13675, partial [Hyphomicrobiaceae bacterium]
DRTWKNGKIVEETRDYLAQDKEGNVWYFGETVDNYVNGKIANHDGSWLAGVDGAKPGIWFKANPKIGDSYRQEYYKGKAEDMVIVVGVGQKATTRYRTFNGCIKTYDWTPLEPDAQEHKYYCREAGGVVLIVNLKTGERTELVTGSSSAARSGATRSKTRTASKAASRKIAHLRESGRRSKTKSARRGWTGRQAAVPQVSVGRRSVRHLRVVPFRCQVGGVRSTCLAIVCSRGRTCSWQTGPRRRARKK